MAQVPPGMKQRSNLGSVAARIDPILTSCREASEDDGGCVGPCGELHTTVSKNQAPPPGTQDAKPTTWIKGSGRQRPWLRSPRMVTCKLRTRVTPMFPVLGLHQSRDLDGEENTGALQLEARKWKPVHTASRSPVSPALYLVGAAAEIMGVTSSVLRADNFTGIALIEVILDSEGYELTRDRLAVKISEMLYSQSDRRFAFGLLMTQTTCTVYMFDHSGAVASQPFNYHQRPIQF
ncbi:hypothetical protein JB92DRAFT_3238394 [Gautieria morchelliformis]|nr:hypothetical protein JB92DRAFT_3238394 [Gautieria morchelliformis]